MRSTKITSAALERLARQWVDQIRRCFDPNASIDPSAQQLRLLGWIVHRALYVPQWNVSKRPRTSDKRVVLLSAGYVTSMPHVRSVEHLYALPTGRVLTGQDDSDADPSAGPQQAETTKEHLIDLLADSLVLDRASFVRRQGIAGEHEAIFAELARRTMVKTALDERRILEGFGSRDLSVLSGRYATIAEQAEQGIRSSASYLVGRDPSDGYPAWYALTQVLRLPQ